MSRRNKYLLTQSLLSSWQYQFRAYDPESAYDDFLAALRKEKRQASEAAQNGKEFEDMVIAHAKGIALNPENPWTKCAQQIGNKVKDSQFQVKAYVDKNIGGMDFLLYGRLDALKAGIIYDIKFSKAYEVGKYLSSPQHPMYFELVPEATRFSYLISDGLDVFEESYTRKDIRPIDKIIKDFIGYLSAFGQMEIYRDKWKAYG